MPELEAAADQPTATSNDGGGESSSQPYIPSFDRDPEPDTEAETTPETQTADETEEASADTEANEELEQDNSSSEETPQGDQFLAKLNLAPEEESYYARRYPTLWKAAQEPNQPADLRQAFADRVNQDRAYAELRDGTQEEETEEVASTATPDAVEQQKQYYAQIDEIVDKQIDQQKVSQFGANLLDAMGVDLKSTDPDIMAIVKNAPKVGRVLAQGLIDLTATILPKLLPGSLEAVRPGDADDWSERLSARSWNSVLNSTVRGPNGEATKPYANLPQIGTPKWNTEIDKVLKEMPELREMYAELPPHQRFPKLYSIAARIMSGQQVSPAIVAQAVATGQKLARTAVNRRTSGKVLGAGKPSGEVQVGGSGNDDLFGPGVQEYKRRGG